MSPEVFREGGIVEMPSGATQDFIKRRKQKRMTLIKV